MKKILSFAGVLMLIALLVASFCLGLTWDNNLPEPNETAPPRYLDQEKPTVTLEPHSSESQTDDVVESLGGPPDLGSEEETLQEFLIAMEAFSIGAPDQFLTVGWETTFPVGVFCQKPEGARLFKNAPDGSQYCNMAINESTLEVGIDLTALLSEKNIEIIGNPDNSATIHLTIPNLEFKNPLSPTGSTLTRTMEEPKTRYYVLEAIGRGTIESFVWLFSRDDYDEIKDYMQSNTVLVELQDHVTTCALTEADIQALLPSGSTWKLDKVWRQAETSLTRAGSAEIDTVHDALMIYARLAALAGGYEKYELVVHLPKKPTSLNDYLFRDGKSVKHVIENARTTNGCEENLFERNITLVALDNIDPSWMESLPPDLIEELESRLAGE